LTLDLYQLLENPDIKKLLEKFNINIDPQDSLSLKDVYDIKLDGKKVSMNILDETLSNINMFFNLYTIDIENSHITTDGLKYISKFIYLHKLILINCPLINEIGKLSEQFQLVSLVIKNCKGITDLSFVKIENLREVVIEDLAELVALNLSLCNNLTVLILSGVPKLKELNLMSCEALTDEGMSHVVALTQIEELNLDKCIKINADEILKQIAANKEKN